MVDDIIQHFLAYKLMFYEPVVCLGLSYMSYCLIKKTRLKRSDYLSGKIKGVNALGMERTGKEQYFMTLFKYYLMAVIFSVGGFYYGLMIGIKLLNGR